MVLVPGPALVPRDVRRDQPEHSLPLESERATSSTARQEYFALTHRHYTAEPGHHAGVRRPVPQRGGRSGNLVHEWLDAEELDVRPGKSWVKRLLRGMHSRNKKPAKYVTELHSPRQQHANTHRLFIKLCWLLCTYAVSADRVVNIDQTSYRLLPVHQIGLGRRGVKQA